MVIFPGVREGICLLIGGEVEIEWNGWRPKRGLKA